MNSEGDTHKPVPGKSKLTLLEDQEYRLIRQMLREENGAIRRTAARLGMSHQSLLRRLQKWPELRQAADPDRPL